MSNLAIVPTNDTEIVEAEIDHAIIPSKVSPEAMEEECCFHDDWEIAVDWLLGKSKHTKRVYFATLNQLSVFLTGEKFERLENDFLRKVSKKDVQAFLYSFQNKGNKPSTIKSKLAALNSLFKHLVRENYRKINPSQNIKLDKENKEEKEKQSKDVKQKTISRQKIMQIIQKPHCERDKVLFELIYSLGLRMHEALNLTWNDFYQNGETVWVRILGKGNKWRDNKVPHALYEKLQTISGGKYIFESNRGNKLSVRACDKNFKIACEKVGLSKEVSVHWLRHSHATHSLEDGKSLVAVRDQLGHSSIAITSKYLHNTESTSISLF
jgi:integrase/recombinase XerD